MLAQAERLTLRPIAIPANVCHNSAVMSARYQTYQLPSSLLFGACLTALGHMRARVEVQDSVRGVIVATIGRGPLTPISELSLTLAPVDAERTALAVAWRARAWEGDRRILPAFMDLLDSLVAQA